MKSKNNIKVYIDGVCNLLEKTTGRNEFGGISKTEQTKTICSRVCFREMSQRASDVELAEAMKFSLSKKIAIQYLSILEKGKNYLALIGNSKYRVGSYDYTRDETYLYLEYIGEVD